MNRIKKNFLKSVTVLTIVGILAIAAGCSGKKSVGDTVDISYWMPVGEDSSFYASYEENPVIQYIESNYTFNDKKIHFDFQVPPSGTEADNFNNLLSTGEYSDVMELSMSGDSPAQLYEDGFLWDLTDLVPEYMPNYIDFLEKNPECAEALYSYVDGEKKIYNLLGFGDAIRSNFEGFCYRRDWLAKYGTNPETGASFTYGFKDENDSTSWYDDVVFPSGGDEPIYISDWEWMFQIFEKAMQDLGITDGYSYSPYYQGYMQTGDLASGFGGNNCAYWYRSEDDTCVFGPQRSEFRAYLQCLNTWYQKGWLDQDFSTHSSDSFFAIDTAKVFTGKVGLWQGRQSTLGVQIDANDGGFTEGAVVYGCRQPINDVYGGEESQNKEPRCLFQYSTIGTSIGITTKLSEDEVITFLKFVDFMFTQEGAELYLGLSKEQVEQSQDQFYLNNGLTDGMYTKTESNGENFYKLNLPAGDPLKLAGGLRMGCTLNYVKNVDISYDRYVKQAVSAWDYYPSTGSIFASSVTNAVSSEDNAAINKIRTNVDQFMVRSVPAMIMEKGSYDIWDDTSWNQYVADINKFQPEKVSQIWQKALDQIKE